MKQADIKVDETGVNPFSKTARLAVVRKNGEVGYIKVSSRGGEKDKRYNADGTEIKGKPDND